MNLKVIRKIFNSNDTVGILYVNDKQLCYTLEDIVRPADQPKVFGKTAIPAGLYNVELRFSPHFQKILPHIINVPGFSDILMHPGNTELDTEGCILVAFHTDNNKIWSEAATQLVGLLTGQSTITITVQ